MEGACGEISAVGSACGGISAVKVSTARLMWRCGGRAAKINVLILRHKFANCHPAFLPADIDRK